MLLQATDPVSGGYGAALLQAFLALGAVCLLAWVVLRMISARRFGLAPRTGHVRILERVPLDPRRSLYLVRVGPRVLLLGGGDGAAPALLAELDPDEVPTAKDRGAAFEQLLGRFGTRTEGGSSTSAEPPAPETPSVESQAVSE